MSQPRIQPHAGTPILLEGVGLYTQTIEGLYGTGRTEPLIAVGVKLEGIIPLMVVARAEMAASLVAALYCAAEVHGNLSAFTAQVEQNVMMWRAENGRQT